MLFFDLNKALAFCTFFLSTLAAAKQNRNLIFFGSCKRCGIFRRQVHFIDTDGTCKDRCVFFEGFYKRSGWECDDCEGFTLLPGPFQPTIDLQDVPSQYRSAFNAASNRWSSAIVGNLPDVIVPNDVKQQSSCLRIPDNVDDIFICAEVSAIDGVNGVLGQAGPEYGRFVNGHVFPFVGIMQFDVADISTLSSGGSFDSVILHEMGHVFGLGTIWEQDLEDLLGVDQCSYKFNTHASEEFRSLSQCLGLAVPLEQTGGPSTACGHWSENCMVDELMTGYASGSLPMSRITIGGLEDLGYVVDYAAADAFPHSQLSPVCDCNRRSLRRSDERSGRGLSEEGYAAALAHGKKHLEKMREKGKGADGGRLGDDVIFLGDRVVVVYYVEDGEIHDVMVRAEG